MSPELGILALLPSFLEDLPLWNRHALDLTLFQAPSAQGSREGFLLKEGRPKHSNPAEEAAAGLPAAAQTGKRSSMNDLSGKQQTKRQSAPHPPLSWDKKLVFSSSHGPKKKGELLWGADLISGVEIVPLLSSSAASLRVLEHLQLKYIRTWGKYIWDFLVPKS